MIFPSARIHLPRRLSLQADQRACDVTARRAKRKRNTALVPSNSSSPASLKLKRARRVDAGSQASGGSGATAALQQIADPDSDLNRQWDDEHDRYVLGCLLDLVEQEFEPTTLRAFRRLALDGASGAQVAEEMGMSLAAVYMAKSRVLQRIRQEAEGLID